MGQFQEGLEPFQLALAEQFDVDPGVGAADDGADGNGNDVQQLVPLAPVDPGVLQRPEIIHNGRALPLSHHSSPLPFISLDSHAWPSLPIYNAIALPITRTNFNLALRGAPAYPEFVEGRSNPDEVEHMPANRRCYDDGIATLRSQ